MVFGAFGLLILAIVSCIQAASPTAVDIIKRSRLAEDKCCYTGHLKTTAYTQQGSVSAEVAVYDNGKKSRMEYVTGPSKGRVILDDGVHVIRLDASQRTAFASEAPECPCQMDLLLANYTPTLQGNAKIAGRECYVIQLKPKSPRDPSKRLWLDKKTMVALKTEKSGANGKLESSTVYTAVDYAKRPANALFAVPAGWKTVHPADQPNTLAAVRKAVGFTPIKPGYVPHSYRFDNYYLRNTPECKQFAGLRYTNGMNTISIFERKGPCPNEGRGRGSCRESCAACLVAGNPQVRAAQRSLGDLAIIVIGDLSDVELKKIADSIK